MLFSTFITFFFFLILINYYFVVFSSLVFFRHPSFLLCKKFLHKLSNINNKEEQLSTDSIILKLENKNNLNSKELSDIFLSLENGKASKEEVLQMVFSNIEKTERKKAVDEVHQRTISLTKTGYWKTKLPNGNNKLAKNKEDLYEKLYEYYFGKADYSFKSIFEKANTENQRNVDATKKRKQQSYNQFISDEFSNKDVRILNYQIIDDYIINTLKTYEQQHDEKILKTTFGNFIGVINAVLKYCQNPLHQINLDSSLASTTIHVENYNHFYRLPSKNRKKAIQKAYQPSDVERLKHSLNERIQKNHDYVQAINSTALLCSANSGMRIAELCALKWSDIDDKSMTIHSQIVKDGKGWRYEASTKDEKYCSSGGRTFPLSDNLQAVIVLAKELQKTWGITTDYVFGREGTWTNPSQLSHALAKISKKLNLPCTNNHALRMYFNSYVLTATGILPPTRAYLLGHSVQVNLDVYTLPLGGDDLYEDVRVKLNSFSLVTQKDPLVTP